MKPEVTFDHEPTPEPRYKCGTCGRWLAQDPTAPTGWAHVPTFRDENEARKAADRAAAAQRAADAWPWTGAPTTCEAQAYRSLGWSRCDSTARFVRDGRPVCGTHVRAERVIWYRAGERTS